jgi:bacteriocin-type transport-associated protein
MTAVLLKELSNPDLDWLLSTGYQTEVSADTALLKPDQSLEVFSILLKGHLAVTQPESTNQSGYTTTIQLEAGELFGAIPWLGIDRSPVAVKTLTNCTILEVPKSQLTQKLAYDFSFAAHLYRASAVLLVYQLDRLIRQLARRLEISPAVLNQPQLREALTVFAELQDRDLDWLIAAGQVQQIAARAVLTRSSRPVDALHILLDGSLGLFTAEPNSTLAGDRLLEAFSPVQDSSESEIARLSRGEMIGETLFVEDDLPTLTVRAVRDSSVLSIPRWRLAAKLLHDVQFASRFYRVLAVLLANKQQAIVRRYAAIHNADAAPASDAANDNRLLARVELAEARFEWMLKRIQAQLGIGRELQW